MSSPHEGFMKGRPDGQTRREWLGAGAAGLAALGVASAPAAAYAASLLREDDAPAQPPVAPLASGSPEAVGMSASRLERVTECLEAEIASRRVTAASVCVARHGRVVLHRGFGRLSEQPGAAEAGAETSYIIASIAKPIAVCGLMLLVEQGRVVLSDPVQQYLPEFVGEHKEKVKVRHLLSHVSGLPDQLPENRELRRSHAPLSAFVKGALATPLLYEPATGFGYQSMGTLLAGEIVERVTRRPLRDFLKSEMFEPLGMARTSLGLGGLRVEETAIYQAGPDSEDLRHWGPNSLYWRDMGHPWGGMHSTAGDLAILLQAFLNGGTYGSARLLAPTTVEAMTRDSNPGIRAPWGLGWALRDSPVWNHFGDLASARTFGHVGATGTVAWADPERQLLCALLTTSGAGAREGGLLNRVSNLVQAAVTTI